jgi:hypothetical protein
MEDVYDLVNTAKYVFNIRSSSGWRVAEARLAMEGHLSCKQQI